ncbi:MAG: M13 family metallopeptidase, partial [Acidobacteriota bacterium]
MKKSASLLLYIAFFTVVVPHRLFGQPQAPESPAAGPGQSLSPRHDFYQYANSETFKSAWGRTSTQSNADVITKLKQLSEAAAAKRGAKGSDEQLIGDLWFTGMDAETLNREGIAPLQPYLDRIDKINSTQDLMDVVADLNMDTRRDSFLFDWIVWRDDDNRKRLVLRLSPGGTTGPGLFPTANPNAERFRAGFRTYLQKTFMRLHNDENKAISSAEAVIDLEAQMARAFGPPTAFTAVTLSELSGIAPSIDWRRYFKKIGLKNTDAVVMQGQAYFRNLGELIRTVPLSKWKDYLRIRLLRVNVGFLDDRTQDEFFQYDRIFTGAEKPRDRGERVVRHLEARLGPPMTRQFFKVHDLGAVKAYYQAIAEKFRGAFRTRIETLDWMTPGTKANARKKLDSMLLTIGYQDALRADFRTMDIRRDVYARNMIRVNRWINQREIARAGTIVDRADPGLSGMPRGDAAYNHQNNEAILPVNNILYDHGRDEAVVYAKLSPLGH